MGEQEKGREFQPVANLFRLLQGAALAELVPDIQANGLHEALLVDGVGRTMDGRNRYGARREVGVAHGPSSGRGRETRRRHLNESQRALVAAQLSKMIAASGRGPRAPGVQICTPPNA